MSPVDFLIAQGAGDTAHSGRTLLDHLVNTYILLKDMGADEDVALAGLFHSVYGTNIFKTSVVDDAQTNAIRDLIGDRALTLVHWFATLDRPRCFLNGAAARVVKDRRVLRDLITIEIANLQEQGSTKHVDALRRLLPASAVAA